MLRHLTPSHDDRLLVDATTGDDAAVWLLEPGRAIVFTADFITPIVDDAVIWGEIAAANAVSDVYAMGGRPLLALNLVAWNREELTPALLAEVLGGAAELARRAGFLIAGGHTIDDPAPKFGLAVIGEVDPDAMLTNAGLRPGQDLILTKALGVGIAATAIKRGVADAALVDQAVASMRRLNAAAARAAVGAGASGATDVTGFGLLGHLGRAARESGVDVTIDAPSVPVFDGIVDLTAQGVVPGGSRRNLDSVIERLDGDDDEVTRLVLADAQTSGGLVFGVDPDQTDRVLEALADDDHRAARIGRTAAGDGRLTIDGTLS